MTTKDRVEGFAKTALALMSEHAVVPTPANYEIFFAFCSGENPAVARILGDRIKAKMPLRQDALDDLHERFFNTARVEKAIDSTGHELAGTVSDVSQRLETAGKEAKAYGRALSVASGELGNEQSPEGMRKLVDGLVAATHAMEARAKDLEADLQRSSQSVSELKAKLDDVRRESLTDVLTGISNRKAFDIELDRAMESSRIESEPVCLLICDIDHFKAFNDKFGHQTGDQVLRLVGSCLADNVKGRDTAARYGGEEFGVILPQTDLKSGVSLANQIRRAVENKKLVRKTSGDSLGSITISIGVAELAFNEDKASFISRADACLYAAKRGGRNQVKCETDDGTHDQVDAA